MKIKDESANLDDLPKGHSPAFQWYPKDWAQDTKQLSLISRSVWFDIICHLWPLSPRGRDSGNAEDWAKAARCTIPELEIALNEFIKFKICDVEVCVSPVENGFSFGSTKETAVKTEKVITITCRRMVRDQDKRNQYTKRQQKHRQKVRDMTVSDTETLLSRKCHAPSPSSPSSPSSPDDPTDQEIFSSIVFEVLSLRKETASLTKEQWRILVRKHKGLKAHSLIGMEFATWIEERIILFGNVEQVPFWLIKNIDIFLSGKKDCAIHGIGADFISPPIQLGGDS